MIVWLKNFCRKTIVETHLPQIAIALSLVPFQYKIKYFRNTLAIQKTVKSLILATSIYIPSKASVHESNSLRHR